jgi:N-glycosylase/DNA lyase
VRVPCPPDFDLAATVQSHGLSALSPHRWDPEAEVFTTALAVGAGAVDVALARDDAGIEVRVLSGALPRDEVHAAVRRAVRRMLRLDEDLGPFWNLCREEPSLSWVVRRRAGRMFASATLFEDLMKLLLTTNCSWRFTEVMVERLVGELGRSTPSGNAAFPSAEDCAGQTEAFLRERVRMGYRAPFAVRLAEGFAAGRWRPEDFDLRGAAPPDVRRRLEELPGFGPYAVGQALRLLGHYEDLALDSWCRNRWAALSGRRRPASDRTIHRAMRRFRPYAGLALWMKLTAHWYGE